MVPPASRSFNDSGRHAVHQFRCLPHQALDLAPGVPGAYVVGLLLRKFSLAVVPGQLTRGEHHAQEATSERLRHLLEEQPSIWSGYTGKPLLDGRASLMVVREYDYTSVSKKAVSIK
jgi:hypothetical protein